MGGFTVFTNSWATAFCTISIIHLLLFQVPLVPLLEVWCTLGGGGPHAPPLPEHSYCMLEELQEVLTLIEEEGQTTSAYQNNHNTPPTLLEHRVDVHSCMGQSMRHLYGITVDQ